MRARSLRALLVFTLMALITLPGFELLADGFITVPIGTVIPLKMETRLSSRTAKVGDLFSATVIRDVELDRGGTPSLDDHYRQLVIPAGSKVEGHVRDVERAERMSKFGVIAVAFDRLIFRNNTSVRIEGTLTSIERASQVDSTGVVEDDRIEGSSRARRAIVFIGTGAGVGAVIGAITNGGKGAAVGAGVGGVAGTLGALLVKGEEAEIRIGDEFAMRVERRFAIDTGIADIPSSRYETDVDPQN